MTVSNIVGQTDIFMNIGFNTSGFATAETGGITNADYYVPAGNAYETIIIYPSSSPRAPPALDALGPGVSFSRSESAESGLTYDRISIPVRRTLSEESRRRLHDYRLSAPAGRAVSLRPADIAAGVNLAAPEYVWTWNGPSASIKRYATAAEAAVARAQAAAADVAHASRGDVAAVADWADIKFGGHPSNGLRTPVTDLGAPVEPVTLSRDSAPAPRAAQVVPPPHPLGPGNWCSGCPMYLSVRSTTPQYSFFSVLFAADARFIPVSGGGGGGGDGARSGKWLMAAPHPLCSLSTTCPSTRSSPQTRRRTSLSRSRTSPRTSRSSSRTSSMALKSGSGCRCGGLQCVVLSSSLLHRCLSLPSSIEPQSPSQPSMMPGPGGRFSWQMSPFAGNTLL